MFQKNQEISKKIDKKRATVQSKIGKETACISFQIGFGEITCCFASPTVGADRTHTFCTDVNVPVNIDLAPGNALNTPCRLATPWRDIAGWPRLARRCLLRFWPAKETPHLKRNAFQIEMFAFQISFGENVRGDSQVQRRYRGEAMTAIVTGNQAAAEVLTTNL